MENPLLIKHSTDLMFSEVLTLCEALLPRKPSKKAGGFSFSLKGGTVYYW